MIQKIRYPSRLIMPSSTIACRSSHNYLQLNSKLNPTITTITNITILSRYNNRLPRRAYPSSDQSTTTPTYPPTIYPGTAGSPKRISTITTSPPSTISQPKPSTQTPTTQSIAIGTSISKKRIGARRCRPKSPSNTYRACPLVPTRTPS